MFENGSEILRFDCHLHTDKDKEFKYKGEQNSFVSEYVEKLERERIAIGVITNHNKFDVNEYKAIRKAAKKKDILILPGVELSVKEGASSVHLLFIFSPDEWLNNGNDFISRTIDSLFLNISDPGNENTCTQSDFLSAIKAFDMLNKDYFVICAHVEQDKGFWKECGGTLITSLAADSCFKRRVLGFQKARTRDLISKVHDWMKYDIAFVEGSDCKTLEEIGKGNESYIKIGEASFSAVKYALKDYENRVFKEVPHINHGYIKEMKCIGGKLSNQVFLPSYELNTLIGIRGSGKSSVLEVLRYALGKEPATDDKYKNELVKSVLGSGGKIELSIVDRYGKEYSLKRIYNEKYSIYDWNDEILNITVDTIIKNPLYFGQKDLALTRKGYEFELLNKIIGDKVPDISAEQQDIQKTLDEDIDKLKQLSDIPNKIADITTENATLLHKLQIYKDKGLDEKLKKQTSCNNDLVKIDSILSWIDEMVISLENAYSKKDIELLLTDKYKSQYNDDIFTDVRKYVEKTADCLSEIKTDIDKLKAIQQGFLGTREKLILKIDSLKEEFAEIKREINDEQLDADSYVSYQKTLSTNKEKVAKLEETIKSKDKLVNKIKQGFTQRNELLRQNYISYQESINDINQQQNQLSVDIEFKGDKARFKDNLITYLKGTGLSEVRYNEMGEKFSDFAAILEDYYLNEGLEIKPFCTDIIYAKVAQKIEENVRELLAIDTPNSINIFYHGKPLSKHSLGQRASALVLFILTQHDSDVIIIDQPEDDLDNQVIYEELIQTIKSEKKDMQFIFATHNANIPVLGDAEKVVTAIFRDNNSIVLKQGTIDSVDTHQDIVNIMEGGSEAFRKRNEIYGEWE